MSTRRTAGFVVAAVAAATTWLIAPSAPAGAATCSTASGVSVVVDHHDLGGGVQSVCDAGGAGKYADRQFTESGFALTYVQRQPGFVCRVDGAPSNDPCVNTPPSDAYWGLWWSDGKSGKWTYSSTGVGSLEVPAGGYVALSWNGSSSSDPPSVAPKAHASPPAASSSPTPTATPTPQPTHTPPPPQSTPHPPGPTPDAASDPAATAPTSTPATATPPTAIDTSSSSTPSASRSAKPHRSRTKQHHTATASSSPSADATTTSATHPTSSQADPPATSGSGLPGWVAPVVAGLLLAAAGAAAVARRRTGRT